MLLCNEPKEVDRGPARRQMGDLSDDRLKHNVWHRSGSSFVLLWSESGIGDS